MLCICGNGKHFCSVLAAFVCLVWFYFVFIFRFCLIYITFHSLFFHAKAERFHQSQLLCTVACFTVIQHLSKHWKEFARSLPKLSLDLRSAVWFVSATFENAYIPPVSRVLAGVVVYQRVHFQAHFSSDSRLYRLEMFIGGECSGLNVFWFNSYFY